MEQERKPILMKNVDKAILYEIKVHCKETDLVTSNFIKRISILAPSEKCSLLPTTTTDPRGNGSFPYHIWSFYGLFCGKVMGFTVIL